jgi:DNA polymerase III subunit alpha
VLGPDINRSYEKFTVENGKIRFGLSPIKNVGSSAGMIVEERKNGPYMSLRNFFERTGVNKRAVINLMTAGAFDLFSPNRTAMVSVVEMYKKLVSDMDDKKAKAEEMRENLILLEGANAVKLQKKIDTVNAAIQKLEASLEDIVLPDMEEDLTEKINAEKEMLGSYISAHPMDEYENPAEYGAIRIGDIASEASRRDNSTLRTSITGVINSVVIRKTKTGKEIAVLEVEDKTGIIKVCAFSNVYPTCKDQLKTGCVFKFTGDVLEDTYGDEEEKSYTFRISKVQQIKKQREILQIMVAGEEKYRESLKKLMKYKDDNGYKLCVLLNDSDTEVVAPFRVSESFKMLRNVKAVKNR